MSARLPGERRARQHPDGARLPRGGEMVLVCTCEAKPIARSPASAGIGLQRRDRVDRVGLAAVRRRSPAPAASLSLLQDLLRRPGECQFDASLFGRRPNFRTEKEIIDCTRTMGGS